MSLCVLGMAEEFPGIAVNALWPRTIIATAALQVIPGAEPQRGRKPEIVADAAWHILTRDSRSATGNFFIDEEVLASAGVTDFSHYAVTPGAPLRTDIFLD
jgi:citronellol/citronellal dehydrogenase